MSVLQDWVFCTQYTAQMLQILITDLCIPHTKSQTHPIRLYHSPEWSSSLSGPTAICSHREHGVHYSQYNLIDYTVLLYIHASQVKINTVPWDCIFVAYPSTCMAAEGTADIIQLECSMRVHETIDLMFYLTMRILSIRNHMFRL